MASKLVWKDTTSYQQGDKQRIPKVLEVEVEGFRIIIHRHKDYSNTWLLSCHELNIEKKDLDTDNFDIAEIQMLFYLYAHLDKYTKLRQEILNLQGK